MPIALQQQQKHRQRKRGLLTSQELYSIPNKTNRNEELISLTYFTDDHDRLRRKPDQKQKPTRQVRFSSHVAVRPHIHIKEYTDEEYRNSWYRQDEILKQHQRRRNRVRFNPSVTVRLSLHVDNYTDDEFENSWYQENELLEIKQNDVQSTIRIVQNGGTFPDHLMTLRGLECRTRKGAMLRKMNRRAAWKAVLEEQERLFSFSIQGGNNAQAELISMAYSEISEKCAHEASLIGKYDECELLLSRIRN